MVRKLCEGPSFINLAEEMSHEASVGIGVGIDAGVGFSICHGDVSPARLC